MKTCIFCDEWGSSAYPEQKDQALKVQIEAKLKSLETRFKQKHGYLAYFQAYTNSFIAVDKLESSFKLALSFDNVEGIIVGTRPDCLSPKLLRLWNAYSQKSFLSVELGVQSFDDDELIFYRRGHTAKCSIEAIKQIKKETDVHLGIHLIFGAPKETDASVLKTAQIVNSLPIDNVKLHNLHVLKNTPLETLYNKNEFTPLSLEEYSRRVCLFLSHLNPDIYVNRLAALSSRWDELVAPSWTRHRLRSMQYILDDLVSKETYQGKYFP